MSEEITKDQVIDDQGAFVASLKRNNRQIREDRATSIAEDAQLTYRRYVEDLEMKLKRLSRELDNMLDMSPDNAQSLILADKFDGNKFVEEEMRIGLEIRDTEIRLGIAHKRYKHLFGDM